MTPTHHLLPPRSRSFAADAIDEHLSVLLDWAGRGEAPDDTPAVIEELRRLNNTRYHDRTEGWYFGTGRSHPALAWSLRPRARITLRMVSRCGFPSTDRAL